MTEVIVGSRDNNVYCLDGRNGKEKWRFNANGIVESSLSLGDIDEDGITEVIVGGGYYVYCLDGRNGKEKWRFNTGNLVYSSPVLGDVDGDGIIEVIIGSKSHNVYCLDGRNGKEKWRFETGDWVDSSPSLGDIDGDGRIEIVVVSRDGWLYLLKAGESIGDILWARWHGDSYGTGAAWNALSYGEAARLGKTDLWASSPGPVVEKPLALLEWKSDRIGVIGVQLTPLKEMLIAFSYGENPLDLDAMDGAYAIDPTTGNLVDKLEAPIAGFAVGDLEGDGSVDMVTTGFDGLIHSIDLDKGELRWSIPTDMPFLTSPTLSDLDGDGTLEIIAAGSTGMILRFDHQGQLLWNADLSPTGFANPPSVGDLDGDGSSEIIVGGDDRVICLDVDSNLLWTFPTGAVTGSVLADLNRDRKLEVVVGDEDGLIHCLSWEGKPLWRFQSKGGISTPPVIGDLDGDGELDILFGDELGNVYRLTGPGKKVWEFPTGSSIESPPILLDLNSDGKLDVMVGNSDGTLFCISHLGGEIYKLSAEDAISSLCVGDLDGDGKIEVAAGSWDGYVYCLEIPEAGRIGWAKAYGDPWNTGWLRNAFVYSELARRGRFNAWKGASLIPTNRPPIVKAIKIGPLVEGVVRPGLDAFATSTIGVILDVIDDKTPPEKLIKKFIWLKNGLPLPGETGETLKGIFKRGDEIQLMASVTDEEGAQTEATSNVIVIKNSKPFIPKIPEQTVTAGEPFSLSVKASDPDKDKLIFSILSVRLLPEGTDYPGTRPTIDPSTGKIEWTAPEVGVDELTLEVTVRVSDGELRGDRSFILKVVPGNRPPLLAEIGDKVVREDEILEFTVSATDPDGDQLRFTVEGLPEGASFENGKFSWRPSYDQAGRYHPIFKVTDERGGEDTEMITITVLDVNRPPHLGDIGDKTIKTGELLQFTLSAVDPDGDAIVFSAEGLPQGASFEEGKFSWRPTEPGEYRVTFKVSDGKGGRDTQEVRITVTPSEENMPPEVVRLQIGPIVNGKVSPSADAFATSTLGVILDLSDDKTPLEKLSKSLQWFKNGSPIPNATKPTLSGAFKRGDEIYLKIVVSDEEGAKAWRKSNRIVIKNSPPTRPNEFNISPPEPKTTDDLIGPEPAQLGSNDPDGDRVTYIYAWFKKKISPETEATEYRNQRILPSGVTRKGERWILGVMATDGIGMSKPRYAEAMIRNSPPRIGEMSKQVMNEGDLLKYAVPASDPDEEDLRFSITGVRILPEGGEYKGEMPLIDESSGEILWSLPEVGPEGMTLEIEVVVDDGEEQASGRLRVEIRDITPTNRAPILSTIGDRRIKEGELLEFYLSAMDPDGDQLSFSAEALPRGASFVNRRFSWRPGFDQSGIYQVTFTVEDGKGGEDSERINITVEDVNRPPELTIIGDRKIKERELLRFTVSATDPDGDMLSFSAQNLPKGASFVKKLFSWKPGFDQSGVYQVTFKVSDRRGGEDSETIRITVLDVNRAPTLIPIGDKSIKENELLRITITATDPDGDTLSFSAQGLPKGASFANRTFSWRPDFDQSGIYHVTFRVSDGKGGEDLDTITIVVQNVNRSPKLAAIGDKMVKENELLRITITATDPDGDTLSFSAQDLPKGASFSNRRFVWKPRPNQVGEYIVTFKVSDGKGGEDSRSVRIKVKDISPPVINHTPPGTAEVGTRIRISVKVEDYSGVGSVRLRYRFGAESKFRKVEMKGEGGSYLAEVESDETGLIYLIEAEDVEGNFGKSGIYGVSVRGEFEMPGGFKGRRYAMFSIPVKADPSQINALLAGHGYGDEWRFYRWGGDRYVEYPDVSSVEPGMAFWLVTKEPVQIKTSGDTVNPALPYKIGLKRGWNQIANPFNFPISLADCSVIVNGNPIPFLEATDLVEPKLWRWEDDTGNDLNDGRYLVLDSPDSILRPWKGCWVYALEDVEIALSPTGETKGGEAPGRLSWALRLDLLGPHGADRGCLIGSAPGARKDHDRYDALKPPAPTRGLNLRFPHLEWGRYSGNYMIDVRPDLEGEEVWEVEVRREPGEEGLIRWEGTLPERFWLYLEDLSRGMRFRMSEKGEYRLSAEGGVLRFRIRATEREMGMEIEGFVPDKTALLQNYPNPFNPETWIPFQLSRDGEVEIRIYDLSGGLVRKFNLGRLEAGLYLSPGRAVLWDGRNEMGERVVGGIYIYHLKVGNEGDVGKMVIVK
jgi:outer membrane protein assembly factor BamB/PKD repeat protein